MFKQTSKITSGNYHIKSIMNIHVSENPYYLCDHARIALKVIQILCIHVNSLAHNKDQNL